MHLTKFCMALAFAVLASLAPAWAAQPWEDHLALLNDALSDVQQHGILAMERHVRDIEAALSGAPDLFENPVRDGKTTFILTDGQAETVAALADAAASGAGDTAAVQNPYPLLSLYLGVYYVEVGRIDDAMRILDQGLTLSPLPDQLLGEYIPDLLSERGVALGQAHRLEEALASYERGIGLGSRVSPGMMGVLHRGRGFMLTELGRLDEATEAYNTSLQFDPGNEIAIGELQYIENLKAGGTPTAPELTIPNDKSNGPGAKTKN